MATRKAKNIPVKTPQPAPAVAPEEVPAPLQKWAPLAILIFTAILYLKALWNGFTFMDDDFYILLNPFIRNFSPHGVAAIFTSFNNYNYHPLTTLTDLLIFHWFGLDPMPYHLLNVALHVINVWLVFRLAERLSSNRITGIIVCLLFAIHPLHVESVAWISERKDVLYTTFYLGALLLYLRYIASGFKSRHYVLALLPFIASLLSKSAAVTLPVLLIAIDIYKGRQLTTKAFLEKVPFLLLSLLFGILAIRSQSAGGAVHSLSLYFSFINRVFLFTSGIAFYIVKLVAPFSLNAMYFFPDIQDGMLPWYDYLSLPFLAGVAWLVFRRSAYKKEIVFGTAFFLITISVMLQIIPVGAVLTAERYTYIPYIGLFYIAGQWVAQNHLQYRKALSWAIPLVVIIFSLQTWMRIDTWKDTDTLFTDIVSKNEGNWRNGLVYNSWGDAKKYEGDLTGAIQKYSESIRLYPPNVLAHYSRGSALLETGSPAAAIRDFNEAILLNPQKAGYYNSRGWAYYQSGNKQAAIADYDHALTLDPKYAEAYNNRGWAYYQAGNIKSSMSDFDKAITIAPAFTKPYYNRAMIAANTGNLAGAIDNYNALIRLNPNDSLAYFNRGIIRLSQKDTPAACQDWKKALDMGYKNAQGVVARYCR